MGVIWFLYLIHLFLQQDFIKRCPTRFWGYKPEQDIKTSPLTESILLSLILLSLERTRESGMGIDDRDNPWIPYFRVPFISSDPREKGHYEIWNVWGYVLGRVRKKVT
jgi:hypothetical protein